MSCLRSAVFETGKRRGGAAIESGLEREEETVLALYWSAEVLVVKRKG